MTVYLSILVFHYCRHHQFHHNHVCEHTLRSQRSSQVHTSHDEAHQMAGGRYFCWRRFWWRWARWRWRTRSIAEESLSYDLVWGHCQTLLQQFPCRHLSIGNHGTKATCREEHWIILGYVQELSTGWCHWIKQLAPIGVSCLPSPCLRSWSLLWWIMKTISVQRDNVFVFVFFC